MTFIPSLDEAYPWKSQADQFPETGEPGLIYERKYLSSNIVDQGFPIDCLLCRDPKGLLTGILYYYPNGGPTEWQIVPERGLAYEPLEAPGNVNIWVDPECQRQGIGTILAKEALERWPINIHQQRFTEVGAKFAESVLDPKEP